MFLWCCQLKFDSPVWWKLTFGLSFVHALRNIAVAPLDSGFIQFVPEFPKLFLIFRWLKSPDTDFPLSEEHIPQHQTSVKVPATHLPANEQPYWAVQTSGHMSDFSKPELHKQFLFHKVDRILN